MTDANLTLYVVLALAAAVAMPWAMPNLFGLKNIRKHMDSQETASATL